MILSHPRLFRPLQSTTRCTRHCNRPISMTSTEAPPAIIDNKGYDEALKALGGLISGKKRPNGSSWSHAFESMRVHLDRLNLTDRLHELKVVHVAGTKGKGSTCAFVESMLRSCGYTTGLYTSPHLCDVRERIRLDGKPINKDQFVKHFWAVYDTLQSTCDKTLGMPAYFRFLTLLALWVFLEERVDAVVLEVGIGGRLDATNCIPPPLVTAVTPLGFDHMELLGNTLREIAGEKAGIFKPGTPAFTVPQEEEAMLSLQAKAQAVDIPLTVVNPWENYTSIAPSPSQQRAADAARLAATKRTARFHPISPPPPPPALQSTPALTTHLARGGRHQLVNAALALQLVGCFEGRYAQHAMAAAGRHTQLPERLVQGPHRAHLLAGNIIPYEYAAGLAATSWPGRCQQEQDAQVDSLTWYLDGAHTPESMHVAAEWFSNVCVADDDGDREQSVEEPLQLANNGQPALQPPPSLRLLLFHCMEDRDAATLLRPLVEGLQGRGAPVSHALFVPPDSAYAQLEATQRPEEPEAYAWHMRMVGVYAKLAQPVVSPQTIPLLPALPTSPALPPLQDATRGAVAPNLAAAVDWVRRTARQVQGRARVQVLVTGSLYLVGDMLRVLNKAPK